MKLNERSILSLKPVGQTLEIEALFENAVPSIGETVLFGTKTLGFVFKAEVEIPLDEPLLRLTLVAQSERRKPPHVRWLSQ